MFVKSSRKFSDREATTTSGAVLLLACSVLPSRSRSSSCPSRDISFAIPLGNATRTNATDEFKIIFLAQVALIWSLSPQPASVNAVGNVAGLLHLSCWREALVDGLAWGQAAAGAAGAAGAADELVQ